MYRSPRPNEWFRVRCVSLILPSPTSWIGAAAAQCGEPPGAAQWRAGVGRDNAARSRAGSRCGAASVRLGRGRNVGSDPCSDAPMGRNVGNPDAIHGEIKWPLPHPLITSHSPPLITSIYIRNCENQAIAAPEPQQTLTHENMKQRRRRIIFLQQGLNRFFLFVNTSAPDPLPPVCRAVSRLLCTCSATSLRPPSSLFEYCRFIGVVSCLSLQSCWFSYCGHMPIYIFVHTVHTPSVKNRTAAGESHRPEPLAYLWKARFHIVNGFHDFIGMIIR